MSSRAGLALAIPLAVLALHAAHYLPFVADDALISLRYAQRFLDGQGLTWTAGPPVEGYSNLLWILAVSALGSVGVDLIDATRILGFLGMGSVVCALFWAFPSPRRVVPWGALGGGLLFATAGPIAVWTVGGLEQPMVAAGLAWTVALLLRAGPQPWPRTVLRAGLPMAAVCLTRPDAPLFTGVFASAVLLSGGLNKRGLKAAIAFGLPSLVAVLGQLAFRLMYYGAWVPNTALLKAPQSRLSEGLTWMGDGLLTLVPLLALAAMGLKVAIARHEIRGVILSTGLAAVLWGAYVALVGGDIFPAWRHLVPLITLLVFPAGVELMSLSEGLQRGQRSSVFTLCALLVGGFLGSQLADPQNKRGLLERWEWDGQVIGHLLRDAFGDRDPYLAVTAAGCVPYFSGLRALDMQGLNDRHIARQPAVPGRIIAHDHGDGAYVYDKAPDLLIFGGAAGGPPKFVSGEQLARDPRFAREYRMVQLEGFDPHPAVSKPWIRLAGKLGVATSAGGVKVPGYLFAGAIGQPDVGPGLVARLPAGVLGASPPLELPAGRWRLRVEPPEAPLGVAMRQPPGMPPVSVTAMDISVMRATRIELVLTAPRGADVTFRSIDLERIEGSPLGTPVGPGSTVLREPREPSGTEPLVHPFVVAPQQGLRVALGPNEEVRLLDGARTLMAWSSDRGEVRTLHLAPFVGRNLRLEGRTAPEQVVWR